MNDYKTIDKQKWTCLNKEGDQGSTLTIQGDGKLDVCSNGDAPGIGSEDGNDKHCGRIVILGGTIIASGGRYSAAIGSAWEMRCEGITISGGTVTAEGSSRAAGIGTSANGSVGDITITSGVTKVTAKKWSDKTPHSIGGGADYTRIGTVTVCGKVGPVSESPFVFVPYIIA